MGLETALTGALANVRYPFLPVDGRNGAG
jgi:hypothetical protein